MPIPPASARDRLRRSRLYLPGANRSISSTQALHEPDAIILDLEDSVHTSEKFAARILVRNALRSGRLSAIASAWCASINCRWDSKIWKRSSRSARPDPDSKVERAEQVARSRPQAIAEIKGDGITRPIWLMPILESALGIENAYAIATAGENVVALTIGLEDYTADLGVVKTVDRRRISLRAHASGECGQGRGHPGDRFGLWRRR